MVSRTNLHRLNAQHVSVGSTGWRFWRDGCSLQDSQVRNRNKVHFRRQEYQSLTARFKMRQVLKRQQVGNLQWFLKGKDWHSVQGAKGQRISIYKIMKAEVVQEYEKVVAAAAVCQAMFGFMCLKCDVMGTRKRLLRSSPFHVRKHTRQASQRAQRLQRCSNPALITSRVFNAMATQHHLFFFGIMTVAKSGGNRI